MRARGELGGDQSSRGHDAAAQVLVPRREGGVDPGAHDGHGAPAPGQGLLVGDGVRTRREPGDDGQALADQRGRDRARDVRPRVVQAARADDAHPQVVLPKRSLGVEQGGGLADLGEGGGVGGVEDAGDRHAGGEPLRDVLPGGLHQGVRAEGELYGAAPQLVQDRLRVAGLQQTQDTLGLTDVPGGRTGHRQDERKTIKVSHVRIISGPTDTVSAHWF